MISNQRRVLIDRLHEIMERPDETVVAFRKNSEMVLRGIREMHDDDGGQAVFASLAVNTRRLRRIR
jgi:hypothetical protein